MKHSYRWKKFAYWALCTNIFILSIPCYGESQTYSCTNYDDNENLVDQVSYDRKIRKIFLAHRMPASNELLDKLNESCADLDLALQFTRSEISNEILAELTVKGMRGIIPQFILEGIYYHLIKPNYQYNQKAYIRKLDDKSPLNTHEKEYLVHRTPICTKALSSLLGKTIREKDVPCIGVCYSGGGFRAAIAGAGFRNGMSGKGFMDAIHYSSELSGSTWTSASWMLEDKSFAEFYPEFIDRISNTFFNKSTKDHFKDLHNSLPEIAERLIAKLIFKEKPSVIDIYGYLLGQNLLNCKDRADYMNVDLTCWANQVAHGKKPFPLATAVFPHDLSNTYSWVSFSPFEVESYDMGVATDAWSFGRKFKNGISTNRAPAMPISHLMGIWGSAISVSLEELYDMVLSSMEPQFLFNKLRPILKGTIIGDARLFAAFVYNMSYKMKDHPYRRREHLPIVDAGIQNNLPLRPLVQRQRNLDIIIVCDASGGPTGNELIKAAQELNEIGIKMPHIEPSELHKPWAIFDDGPESKAPAIVYFSLVKNDRYDPSFDPKKELEGHLGTFNFSYTKEQAEQLAGLYQHNFEEALDAIKELIDRRYTYRL